MDDLVNLFPIPQLTVFPKHAHFNPLRTIKSKLSPCRKEWSCSGKAALIVSALKLKTPISSNGSESFIKYGPMTLSRFRAMMRGSLHGGCGVYLSGHSPFHSDKCSCSSSKALSSSLYSPFGDFIAF